MKHVFSIVFVLGIIFWNVSDVPVSKAQELGGIGIAELYPLADSGATPGDIISIGRDGNDIIYKLSENPNDDKIVGVVVDQPLVLFQTGVDGTPVIKTGQVRVKVSSLYGQITTGDPITSSAIPGRGGRAGSAAIYIVGNALESFPSLEGTDGLETVAVEEEEVFLGDILVDLKIGPAHVVGLTSGADLSTLERFNDTRTAIQIIVAAILALGSIFFAFRNFGSSIQNGILSVGRNPRAKISIQMTVFVHLFLIVLISGAGIFLGFIILSVPIF